VEVAGRRLLLQLGEAPGPARARAIALSTEVLPTPFSPRSISHGASPPEGESGWMKSKRRSPSEVKPSISIRSMKAERER